MDDDEDWNLTARELEVLRLVAEGLMDAEIAERLTISTRTVHSHVARAMVKSQSRTRTHLAVRAIRRGMLPQDESEEGEDQ